MIINFFNKIIYFFKLNGYNIFITNSLNEEPNLESLADNVLDLYK